MGLSQLIFLCSLVVGLPVAGAEPTLLAIGKMSVPAELAKSFNGKFQDEAVDASPRKWGTPTDGLRATLFTWVEPSTPRIHYVMTIENVGTKPVKDFPAATASAEAG